MLKYKSKKLTMINIKVNFNKLILKYKSKKITIINIKMMMIKVY